MLIVYFTVSTLKYYISEFIHRVQNIYKQSFYLLLSKATKQFGLTVIVSKVIYKNVCSTGGSLRGDEEEMRWTVERKVNPSQ